MPGWSVIATPQGTARCRQSLEKTFVRKFAQIDRLYEAKEDHEHAIKTLEQHFKVIFSKYGVEKYDAFDDVGGKLSFALALLDKDNSGIISETEALEIIRNSEKKAEEESSEELNMSSEEGKTDDNTEEEIFDDSSEEPEISESGDTAEVIEFPKDSETEEENDGTEITEEDSESAEELPVEDIYEGSEELGLAG